jgi:hypothetical protein
MEYRGSVQPVDARALHSIRHSSQPVVHCHVLFR